MSFLLDFDGFDAKSLGLLQRIFLVSDGTLTDTLEAAFLEPVGIIKLSEESGPIAERIEHLDLDAGAEVIHRRVLLVGENTRRNYVYAESYLAIGRLPPAFHRELIASDKPMGRLWWEHRLETWKELISVSRQPMGELACHFPHLPPGDLLLRTYRMLSSGRPLMLLSEYFPA